MTHEQIEKAAQQHADELRVSHSIPGALVPMLHDIAKSSYIYGAQDALSHQWISVEKRLPEEDTMCLVFGHQDFGDGRLTRYTMMAWYDGEDFTDAYDDRKYRPEMWMLIPLVPIQLNPEKEER